MGTRDTRVARIQMNQKTPTPPPGVMIFTENTVQVLALLDNRPLMTRERGNIKPNYPNVANSLMGLEFCNRSSKIMAGDLKSFWK